MSKQLWKLHALLTEGQLVSPQMNFPMLDSYSLCTFTSVSPRKCRMWNL